MNEPLDFEIEKNMNKPGNDMLEKEILQSVDEVNGVRQTYYILLKRYKPYSFLDSREMIPFTHVSEYGTKQNKEMQVFSVLN